MTNIMQCLIYLDELPFWVYYFNCISISNTNFSLSAMAMAVDSLSSSAPGSRSGTRRIRTQSCGTPDLARMVLSPGGTFNSYGSTHSESHVHVCKKNYFKKVQAKKLVKLNKSKKNFFCEITFLAFFNFFPVQKFILGHFTVFYNDSKLTRN